VERGSCVVEDRLVTSLLRVLVITSDKGAVTVNSCGGGTCNRNGYDGDARNIKRLRWRIVRPWRLANDPLLLAPNDMSGEQMGGNSG